MSISPIKTAPVVLFLVLSRGAALADGPPNLNIGPSCEAAARGAIVAGRNKDACLGDERAAQDTLSKNWATYEAASKTQCIGNVKTGGPPSYVELLSCLEIMRDAKAIRRSNPLAESLKDAATRPATVRP